MLYCYFVHFVHFDLVFGWFCYLFDCLCCIMLAALICEVVCRLGNSVALCVCIGFCISSLYICYLFWVVLVCLFKAIVGCFC